MVKRMGPVACSICRRRPQGHGVKLRGDETAHIPKARERERNLRLFQNPTKRRVGARGLQVLAQNTMLVGPLPSAGGVLKEPHLTRKFLEKAGCQPITGNMREIEWGIGINNTGGGRLPREAGKRRHVYMVFTI